MANSRYRCAGVQPRSRSAPDSDGARIAPNRPTPIAEPMPVARTAVGYRVGPTAYRPAMAPLAIMPSSNAVHRAALRLLIARPNAPINIAVATRATVSSQRALAREAAHAYRAQPAMPPRFSMIPPVRPWLAARPAAVSKRGVQLMMK